MTDTPKTDADKGTPSSAEPTAPTKRKLPTDEELLARGWKTAEPSGKGFMFIHPMGRPPKKPEA